MLQSAAKRTHTFDWERLGFLYARIALGAASCPESPTVLASTGRNVGYGNFDGFIQYTAKVNSFMPPATIPLLAWADTDAGEFTEKTLSREGNEVREFYAALEGPVLVGIEATGAMHGFCNYWKSCGSCAGWASGGDSGSRDPETEA